MANKLCKTAPNPAPSRSTPALPPRHTDDALDALEMLRAANLNIPEARIAEIAELPGGSDFLKRIIDENYFLKVAARQSTLHPGSGNRMAQWLARHFPTFANKNSDAAKVRKVLEQFGAGGANLLDTLSISGDTAEGVLTRLLVAPSMENGYKRVKKVLKDAQVALPKDTLDRLWLDAVELGRDPIMYRRASEGVLTDRALKALSNKRDRFLDRAASYGVGEDTMKLLLQEAEEVNKAFEDLHIISDIAGLGIGDVTKEGIQYMPRQFTSDFKFRMRALDDDVSRAFTKSPTLGFEAAFTKSRSTHDLVVEDELILASVLDLVDNKRVGELQKKIDTVTDDLLRADLEQELEDLRFDATDKLAEMINADGIIQQEILKLPTELVERLLDSGVLSKIPMSTTEIADHLIKKHGLPYAGIDELLTVDPVQAWNKAREQLSRRMEKSFILKGASRNAIETGWGVTDAMKAADPEFANFVKLSDDLLKKAGIEKSDGMNFHPMVADSIQAILDIGTDPATLGEFAAVWEYTWKIAKEQVLTTSGFLGRQVMQLFVQAGLAGTNIAHLIPSLGDWTKYQKVGIDVFDNTKKVKVGDTEYTLREVMQEAVQRGLLDSDAGVGVGNSLGRSGEESLNPLRAGQALHKWASVATGQGALPRVMNGRVHWDAVEYGADLLGRASGDMASHVMGTGMWLEQAFKVAFLKTKLDQSLGNTVAQLFVGRRARTYNSLDEIFDEMGNYFLDYGTRGVGDQMLSKRVMPFWMYMSRSTPAVFRHVLQNPTQYVLYNRLYALANGEARRSEDDLPEGGVAPWQQGSFGHAYLPHPRSTESEPRWIHIPFASVDPIAEVLERTDNMASALLGVLGFRSGNSKEQLQAVDPRATSDVLRGVFGTFGPGKSLYALATRTDDRGKSLILKPNDEWETMLGLPVVGGKYAPITRTVIENTLPLIANLDRWNPGEIFGVKEKTDVLGRVTREGKPSVFGFNRSANDGDVDDLATGGLLGGVNIARGMGITVNSIDTMVNMGYTEREMNTVAKELKKSFTQYSAVSEDETLSEPQRRKAREMMVTTAALYLEVETGRIKAGKWINSRDFLTEEQQEKADREALKRLKKDQRATNKTNSLVRALGGDAPENVDPKTLSLPPDLALPTRVSDIPQEDLPEVVVDEVPESLF